MKILKCDIKFTSDATDVVGGKEYFFDIKRKALCTAIWNNDTFSRPGLVQIGEELIRMAKED